MILFYILLVFIPVSLLAYLVHAPGILIFFTTCLAIIPLAGFMGRATEEIAAKKGPVTGGLLNATFGNATELIISFIALKEGLVDVVKASLTGSIIGNLLLVMGLSILAGGIRHKSQTFNRIVVSNGCTMLAIAVIGLVVPAVFSHTTGRSPSDPVVVAMSVNVAVCLLIVYGLGLLFSLHTHRDLFISRESCDESGCRRTTARCYWVLLLTTALVALESEILVKSIGEAVRAIGFTEIFVGVVIVAIIGNAAEHGVAVQMAWKNKIDLAISVAVGSSTQIALFVAPVLVLAGCLMGKPMSLVFTSFEVLSVGIAVLIASLVALDGESNWYEGVLLLVVYFIIGIAFYFL